MQKPVNEMLQLEHTRNAAGGPRAMLADHVVRVKVTSLGKNIDKPQMSRREHDKKIMSIQRQNTWGVREPCLLKACARQERLK